MNSLTYLSRQFDVLAAARTPPPTPASSQPPSLSIPDTRPRLQRTLSFLYPSSTGSSSRSAPRRSSPSPALQPPSSSSAASSISTTSSSGSTTQRQACHEPPSPQRSRPRPQLDTMINQVFFIRFFLLVWHNLNSAWSALLEQLDLHIWSRRQPMSAKSEKGKDKEIHILDEVSLAIRLKLGSPAMSRSSTSSADGSPAPLSRASTPAMHERRSRFPQKTLVLDLDETLIHSTSRPNPSLASSGSGFFGLGSIGRGNKSPGHTVEVILGGKHTQYHVYKRPFVDFFLRTVSCPGFFFVCPIGAELG